MVKIDYLNPENNKQATFFTVINQYHSRYGQIGKVEYSGNPKIIRLRFSDGRVCEFINNENIDKVIRIYLVEYKPVLRYFRVIRNGSDFYGMTGILVKTSLDQYQNILYHLFISNRDKTKRLDNAIHQFYRSELELVIPLETKN